MANTIQYKRGTKSRWASLNPLLAIGEVGFEKDTRKTKIGDGTTLWNSLEYENAIAQYVTVGTKNCDYTSIKEAVEYAGTQATAGIPYIVKVYPGIYTESPFSMQKYVSVIGEGSYYNTIIKTNDLNNHFISGAPYSEIRGLAVEGPTANGKAAIYLFNVNSGDRNYPFKVIEVAIRQGYYGVYCYSNNGQRTKIHCFNVVNWMSGVPPYSMFRSEGKSNIVAMSCAVMSGAGITNAFECISGVDGDAEMTLDLCSMRSATTGLYLYGNVSNSSYARMTSCSFTGGTNGIISIHSNSDMAGCVINDSVINHLNIDADSNMQYSGSMDKNRVTVSTGGKLSATFTDNTLNEEGQVVFGELWLGTSRQNSIPLKDYGQNTYYTGWLNGGEVTTGTGLSVNVAGGYGYVNDGTGVYKVTWTGTTIPVSSNVPEQYIYVTAGGVVTADITEPNYANCIVLSSVTTNTTDVQIISDHKIPINHHIMRMAEYLEEVVGPISVQGGTVTVTGTNNINVQGGEFYRIFDEQNFSGGNIISFTPIRRGINGMSTPLYGTPTTSVDLLQYDSANNTLSAIPLGKYVKHCIWVSVGADGTEYYNMVYGQNVFDSQILAEQGTVPVTPVVLQKNALRLYYLIVHQNDSIVSVVDGRPKLGQMASATATITNHNDLSGRDTDIAHAQYALKSNGVVQAITAINATNGSSIYSSGGVNIVGGGIVSVSYNGNSIILNASNITANRVHQVNGLSGTVQIAGSDNVTVSTYNGSIVVQGKTDFPYIPTSDSSLYQSSGAYLTTAAQSNQVVNSINGGTGQFSFNTGSSLSSSVNGNSITFGLASNITTALQSAGAYLTTAAVSNQVVNAFNGQTGNRGLSVGSSLSSSVNGGTTTFGLASNITTALQSAGAYLTTAAVSNQVVNSINGGTGQFSFNTGSSLSSSVNGNSITWGLASNITTALQSANANYLTIQSAEPRVVSFNGTSGSLSLAVGSSLSSSVNGGTTTFGLASNITTALQSAGNYLTTAAQSNQVVNSINGGTGQFSFNTGSSLSSSVNGNSITWGLASNITTALQSANANYLTSQTNQTGISTMRISGNTSGSSNLITIGSVNLLGGNGITLSMHSDSTNNIVIVGGGGGVSTGTISAVGNTLATNSVSATWNISNLQFSGAGIASVGVSNGSVVVHVPAGGGGGDGVNVLSVGSAATSLSQTYYMNSNTASANGGNVVFGLSGNTVTASYVQTVDSADIQYILLQGNSGGTSSISGNNERISIYGGNNISLSGVDAGYSIIGPNAVESISLAGNIAAGANSSVIVNSDGLIYISGGNNITLSGTSNSIGISAGDSVYISRYENIPMGSSATLSLNGNTQVVCPFVLPRNVSVGFMRFPMSVAAAVSNTFTWNTGANTTFTYSNHAAWGMVVYSQGAGISSRSLQYYTSTSCGMTWQVSFSGTSAGSSYSVTHNYTLPSPEGNAPFNTAFNYNLASSNVNMSTTHMSNLSGSLVLDMPFAASLPAGNYHIAFWRSTTSGNGGTNTAMNVVSMGAMSLIGVAENISVFSKYFGSTASNTVQPIHGLGYWTTNGPGSTSSIGINNISANIVGRPYFQLVRMA